MIFLEKYIRYHENDNIECLEKNRVTQSTHYISKIHVISTSIDPVRQSRVIKHIYTVDTGSGKDDDINIIKAVEGFLEFNTNEEFVDDEEKIIINLIKATRLPYTQDCEELTIHQKILRDSDILQGVFCQNYINGVVFAIAKEANISPEKMLEGQIKFLESATFCTEWAPKIYKGALPLVIKKVEEVRKYF